MTVLWAILGLQAIILVHETGHFLAARLVGLPVERFSLGFPPFILRRTRGGVEYCIGAIPLGGFVKVDLGTGGDSKSGAHWAARLLAALSGPLANLLMSIVILFAIYGFIGQEIAVYSNIVGNADNALGLAPGDTVISVSGTVTTTYEDIARLMDGVPRGTLVAGTPSGRIEVEYSFQSGGAPGFIPHIPPVIGESILGMPAYEAGIRTGDSLVAVNGEPVAGWADLLEAVDSGSGDSLTIAFVRDGRLMTATVEPVTIEGNPLIGVVAETTTRRQTHPLLRALGYSVASAVGGAAGIFGTIFSVFSRPGELVQMSGGPVYIAETLNQQAGFGLARFLDAMAALSLAIMCFNLLPIPVLDGGHAVFLIFEGIAGRPMSKRGVALAQNVGMLVLLLLLGLILWKDLTRVLLRVRL